jgi:hypothetical protein
MGLLRLAILTVYLNAFIHTDRQVSLHAAHLTDPRSGMDWSIARKMHENPSLASTAQ